jgi:NADPH-dependent curcumin reductase CurA
MLKKRSITAAAGGSGHFAVQLAEQPDCTVVGICPADEKARSYRKRHVSTVNKAVASRFARP